MNKEGNNILLRKFYVRKYMKHVSYNILYKGVSVPENVQ